MNCHDARILIGAEPNRDDPEVIAHIAQCPECARFQLELRMMEPVLRKALQVDIGTIASRPVRSWRKPAWAVAASVIVAICAAMLLWLSPRETFAQQVVRHAGGEPAAFVATSQQADAAEIAKVLSNSGVRLRPGAARVTYVMSCWFRGHFVPHLAVQTERGPVIVLVLTHERAGHLPQRIAQDGFDGVVVPAPRGVLVVLARDFPVDAIAATVLSALDYEV